MDHQKYSFSETIVNIISTKSKRLIRIIFDLIATIIGFRYPTQQRYLPPINDRLLLEPAVQLSQKIKSGKLKSEQVIKAYIDRCRSVQPHINAIIQNSFDSATNQAKEVDERVKHELEGKSPLNGQSIHSQPFLGIPFTTKDSISVKDMYLTSGLHSRKGITALEDSDVIDLMRKAGAIFIALTNVPELVMWWHSFNILYGRTNNPYDKSRIPGGSSGGEGALLSSAGSVIGMGSDIGGSIREPSYFCGIFGHKTTSGIVSTNGMYPKFTPSRQKLLSVGPMCRYATDLKPMLKVMAGNNVNKLKLDQNVDISKLKVYYMEGHKNPSVSPLMPEIKDALSRVIKYFEIMGLNSKKVYFEEIEHGFDIWMCAMEDESAPKFSEELTNLSGSINPFIEMVKSVFGLSNYTLCSIISCFDDILTNLSNKQTFNRLSQMREKLTKQLHQILGNDGIFIFPAHPETAPKHNGTLLKVKNISYTCLFNPLNVAITSVPLGLSKSGLPIGIQIIASPYNDHLGIAIAEELERAFGGWVPPCQISCYVTQTIRERNCISFNYRTPIPLSKSLTENSSIITIRPQPWPPYVVIYEFLNKSSQICGPMWQLVKEIAIKLEARVSVEPAPQNASEYGVDVATGHSHMFLIPMSAFNLGIMAQTDLLQISRPLGSVNRGSILSAKFTGHKSSFSYFLAFDYYVWFGILLTLITFALINSLADGFITRWPKHFWYLMSLLLSDMIPQLPTKPIQKFILAIWLFFTLIILSGFSGSMIEFMLTVPPFDRVIDSWTDLYDYKDVKILVPEFSMFQYMIDDPSEVPENYPLLRKQVENFATRKLENVNPFRYLVENETRRMMQFLSLGSVAQIFEEKLFAKYLVNMFGKEFTNLHISDEDYGWGHYFLPLGHFVSEKFKHTVNNLIIETLESGLYNLWIEETIDTSGFGNISDVLKPESYKQNELQFSHLKGVFYLSYIGIAFSIIVIIIELITFRLQNKKKSLQEIKPNPIISFRRRANSI